MISTGNAVFYGPLGSEKLTRVPLISTRFSRRAHRPIRRRRWGTYSKGVNNMGYNRSDLDKLFQAAEQVKINLAESIKQSGVGANSQAFDPLPLENDSKPADPIYPDDLVADVGVKIEPLPDVPEYDPKKQIDGAKPENPQTAVDKHEQNVNAYMDADAQIKAEFLEELNNVDPEVAAAVAGAMPIPGGTSGLTMLGSLADDAIIPGAGDIWRAIDDIMSQTSNPDSKRVKDAIAQTISNLQQSSADAKASNTPGAPKPINWDALSKDKDQAVNQMQNFLMRDPKKDPLMQTLLDNEPKLEQMQKNWEKRQEFEAGEVANVEVAAIQQAVDAGDRGLVKALVQGPESSVDLAMAGDVQGAITNKLVSNSFEIDARMKGEDLKGVKAANDDIFDLDVGAKAIAKAFTPALKIADPKVAPMMDSAFG